MTISQAELDEAVDLWEMLLAQGLQSLDAFKLCTARIDQYLEEQERALPVLDAQFHVGVARA